MAMKILQEEMLGCCEGITQGNGGDCYLFVLVLTLWLALDILLTFFLF